MQQSIHAVPSPHRTAPFVKHLKDSAQDFEWYPTTEPMLEAVKADMEATVDSRGSSPSVLDCGAGDGRALHALTSGDKYAIEKSKPLLAAIKHDVFVIGTDFHQQTLLDKKTDVIFSNMPYSEFVQWAIKIIKEGNAQTAYLVMPQRWEDNIDIAAALEERSAEAKVIFEGDFLDADRRARARVHVVRIELANRHGDSYVEPFALWFDEHFKISASKDKLSDWQQRERKKDSLDAELDKNHEVVEKEGLIEMLTKLYNRDLDKLMSTYTALSDLDPELLTEMDVSIKGVRASLRQRIVGLKALYWQELFERLSTVTDRLTARSRETMFEKLTANTSIDFTIDNAHAIALWVVKNANQYFDSQLIKTMERMIEKANLIAYKSNQRTFGEEAWRYTSSRSEIEQVQLDYRIVLECAGGLSKDWYDGRVKGLKESSARLFDDIATIARNIGFDTAGMPRSSSMHWDSGVKNKFMYRDNKTGELKELFEAKAFKNGNVHIRFNQAYMCALNCEFGRLKGWLKTREQAAEELDIDISEATGFGTNLQLEATDLNLCLGFDKAA